MRFRLPTLVSFPMRTSLFVVCALALPLAGRADTAAPFARDARFRQNVSLRIEGMAVSDLLARLSAKTGVALRAAGDVGDDKVIVFCPSRPLGDTLNDLAALFNDEWQRTPLPNGQTRWRLTRKLSARHYEDGLEQAVIRNEQALLDEQARAADETPEQTAQRPVGNRIRNNLQDVIAHGRQASRLYAQLSREQRDMLFARGFVNVGYASFNSLQQAIARAGFDEERARIKTLEEYQKTYIRNFQSNIDPPELLEQHGARFYLYYANGVNGSARAVAVVLGQNTSMGMDRFDTRDEWLLPRHGNPYTRSDIGKGKVAAEVQVAEGTEMAKADLPNGDALRKVDKAGLWIDRLRTLSTTADVPVLADYYRCPPMLHDFTLDPLPSDAPVALLDAFCKPSGYLWWTRGQTLLLRKSDWYMQRRYEAPDRWMRDMAARLRHQRNYPTYGDVCRLLELTPQQISGMNMALQEHNKEANVDIDTEEGLRELLALIQGSRDPRVYLPLTSYSASYDSESRLLSTPPTPHQIALTGDFLKVMRQPDTPYNLKRFIAEASCLTPEMLKSAEYDSSQDVHLYFRWKLEGNSKPVNYRDQSWLLRLPLLIPSDRSDKTQIEVTP